jgi:chromosome segregation ATPase
MSADKKEQLDELISEKEDKEQQLGDLEYKLGKLKPEEYAQLEEEQDEFLKSISEQEQEVDNAEYATEDPEESRELREMDWAELRDERYTRLVEEFPAGITILENEIDEIENQMLKLIPVPDKKRP